MKPIKYLLTKQISDELEQKIQKDEYKIGDKIPTEPELVEYFGIINWDSFPWDWDCNWKCFNFKYN